MSTRLEDPRLKRLRRQAKKRDWSIVKNKRSWSADACWVVEADMFTVVFGGTGTTLDEIERFLQEAS